MSESTGWRNRLSLFFASIAPGLFLIGYNIGTGSITTMAATGAEFGMQLYWALLLSCVFTFVLIITFGKFTLITGDTTLSAFKTHFGKWVAGFVLLALLFSEGVSSMGVMAVVTQVVQEWSRPLTASGQGISPLLSTSVFVVMLYGLFWIGRYRFFEKVLALFVTIMGFSFLFTMIMVIPDPAALLEGLIPNIPSTGNAPLLIAGMVGTTMGAVLYVVRSIIVKEKGWTIADLKLEKRDAFVSALLMFLLSLSIMACAAATLHPLGLRVENAIDMVKLLEPLAGRFAISIFVGGIVAAGLSSLFPIIILAPWLFADFENKKADMTSTRSRLMVLAVLLLGFVVPIFGGRPVSIMIISQAFIAVVTPIVIGLMMVLQNRPAIMGAYTLGWKQNLSVGITFLFALLMSGLGIKGILGL
ncbi:MAG: Nramp family divalent metal transporter [Bacteroidota bacterium]